MKLRHYLLIPLGAAALAALMLLAVFDSGFLPDANAGLVVMSGPRGSGAGGGGGGGGDADADFAARKAASGVWKTDGFDAITSVTSCGGGWPSSGTLCYEPGSCGNKLTVDSTTYASGISGGNHKSLRLDTQSCGDSNQSGDLLYSFGASRGVGTHFYYSFAWRAHGFVTAGGVSSTSPDMTGQGWKIAVLAANGGPLCGTNELTIVNFDYLNKERLYTACSSSQHDNFEFSIAGGDFSRQQTDSLNTFCTYNGTDTGAPQGTQNGCRRFMGDEWQWFYVDVTMRSGNADVKAYTCHAGDAQWVQWISALSYSWGANSFGMIDFSDYDTGKGGTTPTVSPYSMWYDEMIISDSPIAVPAGCA